ncbi:unnamed protein product [Linum trigynum]|uniref:Uncharacterized protein n=1 Tax=Linum trigynum TaxID=586398 RepID=A0AAV2F6F3_9ROSI
MVNADLEFEKEPLEVSVEEGQTSGDLVTTEGDPGDQTVSFVDVVKGPSTGVVLLVLWRTLEGMTLWKNLLILRIHGLQ